MFLKLLISFKYLGTYCCGSEDLDPDFTSRRNGRNLPLDPNPVPDEFFVFFAIVRRKITCSHSLVRYGMATTSVADL